MNKHKKLWIGVISLTLAILLFAVLLIVQSSLNKEPETGTVLCVKTDIPQNLKVTDINAETYIEVREMPVKWIPEDALTAWEQIYDMVIRLKMAKGTILTKEMIDPYEVFYAGYEELTWISVPVKELYQGVAGSLRAGDFVDVYAVYQNQSAQEYQSVLLAEKVRIQASYDVQGTLIEAGNTVGLTQLIVIPMEKAQVSGFYEKLEQGNIRIAKYEN